MNRGPFAGDTLVPLLERIADERGVAFPPERAERAGEIEREHPGQPESVWEERLGAALDGLGVQPRPTSLSVREVAGAVRGGLMAVTYRRSARNPGGWLLVLDAGRDRVYVADLTAEATDRWVGADDLARALDVDPTHRIPWLLCDPVFPTLPVADSHGPHGPSPMRRLAWLVQPDRRDLGAIVVFGLVVGTLTLATPIAVQQLVNSVALGGLLQPVVVLAFLLFAGLSFSATLSVLQAYVAEIVQRRIFVRVVADLAQRFPRVRIDALDGRHGPELVNRFFDVLTVQKIGTTLLLDGVALSLQTMVGLLVLSFYHPLMLAFSVVLLGGIAVVVFVFGRGAIRTAIAESQSKYAVEAWLEELARNVPVLKTAPAARFALERADSLAREYLRTRAAHYRIVFRQLAGALGLQVMASSALLAIGGGLVIAGQLTLGQLVASELIITAIVASFAKLGKQLESYYDLLAAVDKLGTLFDLPVERAEGVLGEPTTEGAAVTLRDVGFAYGAANVIDGFDLEVQPGERVALIGPSGAGKSTLFDLVLGLRSPDAGYVTVDGIDVRELRLDALREHVARIGGPEILGATIEENVRMGRAHVTARDIRDALAAVGLLEHVRALPHGVHTRLVAGGAPLSSGQALRLTIARAIAGRPRVILLDGNLGNLEDADRAIALDALFAPDRHWTILAAAGAPPIVERCERAVMVPARTRRWFEHAAAAAAEVPA